MLSRRCRNRSERCSRSGTLRTTQSKPIVAGAAIPATMLEIGGNEILRSSVSTSSLSTQKFEARFQSAAVSIGERERPAKRADKLLGDGKAKPGATGFAIARSFDPIKRQEYRLQMLVGNTGAAVRYGDRDVVRPLRIDGDFDVLAELQPVIDQVDHDAAQGLRVRENSHPAFSGKAKRFSGVGIVADDAVDQRMQVGLAPLLADFVAPAGQGE